MWWELGVLYWFTSVVFWPSNSCKRNLLNHLLESGGKEGYRGSTKIGCVEGNILNLI